MESSPVPNGRSANVTHHARIMLRPMGTPLPLGILALGIASFVLSGVELHVVPQSAQHDIALVLFAFVAPAQLLAGILGFWARDPVAGTGMGVLAGTWLITGLTLHSGHPGGRVPALGLLLCASAVALLVPTLASGRSKLVVTVTMFLAAARFAVTGSYHLGASHGVQHAGGILGLVLAGVALYAALSFELEGATGQTVLPTFRPHHADRVETGGLGDELAGVLHEAGVRRTL